MRKRMLALILGFIMLTSTAFALEWDPYYVYDGYDYLPMSEHDVLAYKSGSAAWITDGTMVRTVDLPGNVTPVWRFDGTCSLLSYQRKDRRSISWYKLLYWESSDADPVEVYSSAEPCLSVRAGENIVAILKQEDDGQSLQILDGYGNNMSQVHMTGCDGGQIVGIRQIEGNNYWIEIYNQDQTYSTYHIMNGQIVSSGEMHSGDKYSVGGSPYFLISKVDDSKYSDWTITELTDSDAAQTHYIYGKNVVITFKYIEQTEAGGYVITGSAVANSRKIYCVFRMYVSDEWKLQSIDVRDCSYHGDYYPGIVSVYEFDYCMVRLSDYDDSGAPDVWVPFDDLPVAQNPGLGIR